MLQAVEILAVDQRLDAPSENHVEKLRSVTLLVTPEQASLLDLGQNMGTLALSLRNPSDVAKAETEPATVNVLRFTQKDPNESESKPTVAAPSFLATAAAAAAKAAVTATLSANDSEPTVAAEPEPPQYLQTYTLRGRSTGRIMVRNN